MIPSLYTSIQANRRALTLIELLAALVVLSLFVPLAGGWLVSATKATTSLTVRTDSDAVAQRAVRMLLDDLDAADPSTLEADAHSVSMLTLHPAPGEYAQWRNVRWAIDGSAAIVRTSKSLDESAEENHLRILSQANRLTVSPIESASTQAFVIELEANHFSVQTVWEALP